MTDKRPKDGSGKCATTVLGAGMWGSVIASLLQGNGNRVRVWDPVPQAVEQANNGAGAEAAVGGFLLEAVELADDADGDDDGVVGELEYRVWIVNKNIRVQDVVLSHSASLTTDPLITRNRTAGTVSS